MRIALFSETYLPQRNGVALVLDRLVRWLADRGHRALVVAPEPGPGGEVAPGAVEPLPEGSRVVRIPGIPLPRYPDLTLAAPFHPRARRAVEAFAPEVVHLVSEFPVGVTGLRLAGKREVPTVASFHTHLPRYLRHYGLPWAEGLAWRWLRAFHRRAGPTLAPSHVVRVRLLERGFGDVRLWPRGVDSARFDPGKRSEEVRRRWAESGDDDEAGALYALYVGRLTPEKELPLLFRAWDRARRAAPELRLVVVGGGAYAGTVRREAPPGVRFTGYLEGDDLARAYASADVFAFPSRAETLGNVVVEAMASGLPVVAAAEGGTLESVAHGETGLLVPAGDADAFAGALLRLVRDDLLRKDLGRNARRWARKRTWDDAFGTLVEAYADVAGRPRP